MCTQACSRVHQLDQKNHGRMTVTDVDSVRSAQKAKLMAPFHLQSADKICLNGIASKSADGLRFFLQQSGSCNLSRMIDLITCIVGIVDRCKNRQCSVGH